MPCHGVAQRAHQQLRLDVAFDQVVLRAEFDAGHVLQAERPLVLADLEDDVLILTCRYNQDLWIEITPDQKLYISGERIYLDRYQKR